MTNRDAEKCSLSLTPKNGDNGFGANARLTVLTLNSVLAVSLSAPAAFGQAGLYLPPNALIDKVDLPPFSTPELLEEDGLMFYYQENVPCNYVYDDQGVWNFGFIGAFARHRSRPFIGTVGHVWHCPKPVKIRGAETRSGISQGVLTHGSHGHLSGCFGWSARAHGSGSHS